MRKLVLGIIALVAVQFAFVTYTMLLQSSDELTADLANSQPVLTTTELVNVDQTANSEAIVTKPEAVSGAIEPQEPKTTRVTTIVPERTAKSETSSGTRPSKPAFVPAQPAIASPSYFTPVVIRYRRDPAPSDCEVPKTKKRTDIAKARPIIKRPWDWLKAIGSKLN